MIGGEKTEKNNPQKNKTAYWIQLTHFQTKITRTCKETDL